MRRSKSEIYLHLIWATKNREPLLTGPRERIAYRCIEAEAQKLHVQMLAIGGMPDHVHIVVKTPTTVSPSMLVKQVKGVSSLSAKEAFAWQEGYGVFSISRTHVTRVVHYVEHQAQHHANHTLWPECEEDGEDVEGR